MALLVALAAPVGAQVLGPPVPDRVTPPTPLAGGPRAPAEALLDDRPIEPGADAVLQLSLPEALRLGLARSRDLTIEERNAIIARADETAAYGVYTPQIEILGDFGQFESASRGFQTGAAGARSTTDVTLRIEQLLFDTLQGLYGLYSAEAFARAAELDVLATQLDVAARIASVFLDTVQADALTELARALLAQSTEELAVARGRFEAQVGAEIDIARAQVQVLNAQVELSAAENQVRDALARLRRELLLPPGTPLAVTDTVAIPPVDVGLAEALAVAAEERPDSAAAAAAARAQRHLLSAARARRWLDVRVSASFEQYLHTPRNIEHEYVIGAAVTLPIWDGQQRRLDATVAEQRYRIAALQLEEQIDDAALQVEQSFITWADATERLDAAQAAVELAATTVEQVEESYRLGVASLIELNEARTEFRRAETNRIQARIQRDRAAVALRLAMGRLPLLDDAADSPADTLDAVPAPAGDEAPREEPIRE